MKVLKFHDQIHIHPLFFLLAFSALLTGAIYDFIVLFSIVIAHELGHFLMAKRFGWRVERMEIWLFGGAVVSEEHNTRPFREQMLVVIAGPFQHLWIFVLLMTLQSIIGVHPLLDAAFFYNGVIFLFNMLPVWPLDGGKLLFYLLNRFFAFRVSLAVALSLSLLFMTFAGFWMFTGGRWTLAAILLTAFLFIENVLEWKRKSYTMMRYLLYCTYQNRESLKTKYVNVHQETLVRDVLKNIHSNRRHKYVLKHTNPFYIVDEQECLRAFFEQKKPHLKVRDIAKIAI
ncbi:site-2 protease family protein [Halobacillus sp. GSS1]|uniref:site-2 protease family protein n=1 Tax=Halobacillus sp. GSS1 TaxID=2815919 RepID=UPI001A906669|nr:site-2 protease family protein [Halobacillus sp. GSS1]MBN9653823.1 site-2 protease family protein [Halobacillus sp. GSS1]